MSAFLVALAACGSDEPEGRAQAPLATGSEESSPFTVGPVPDGFVARSAGRGTGQPVWSEDSTGSDEPYLVLSPDGTPDHPDVVVVSTTGYQGYQGGLDQASAGYGEAETVEVDGETGRYTPADGTRWADLVVARGEADVAVRVSSPDADLDELAAVAERVEASEDTARPPTVPDVPDDLRVVGAGDAFAVITRWVDADPWGPGGPGPTTAHGVGWVRAGPGDDVQLTVMTLPGRSADVEALAVGLRWQEERYGEEATVEYRDGHVSVEHGSVAETVRSVWSSAPSGDLVVASSSGPDPVALDDLLALARSVRPTDAATWDAFVGEVLGGPGLAVDPGRTELARGMVGDGRGWLLQDAPPGAGGWAVDRCLVLTGGDRACATSESGDERLWSAAGLGEGGSPAFTVVATTWPEAGALFLQVDGNTDVVPLVAVPGTDQRAAAVVGEGYEVAPCPRDEDWHPRGDRWIELVTDDIAAVTCAP